MIDICERIYKAMANPSVKDDRSSFGAYPSSASIVIDGKVHGACMRREYYRWYKCQRDGSFDPQNALKALLGDYIDDMVSDFLRWHVCDTNLIVLSSEHRFSDSNYLLSGRSDILLQDLLTKKVFGTEVKSVGDYVAGMTIDEPKMDNLLQSLVYLDQFKKGAKSGGRVVDGWAILYVARSENYKLRRYPHGSPFQFMWQFWVTLAEDGHAIVTNQNGVTKEHHDITIDKIYERYDLFLDAVRQRQLPDREFVYQYDEPTLVQMCKQGDLNKADTHKVEKWLDKGAKAGELKMDKGDFECRYCPFAKTCYSENPEEFDKEVPMLYDIPQEKQLIVPKKAAEIF